MTQYKTIEQFKLAVVNMRLMLPTVMQIGARNSCAKMATEIKKRVTVDAVSVHGDSFSPYSKRHITEKIKSGASPLGKKVDKKNFYYKGYLWATFAVQKLELNGDKIHIGVDFSGNNETMPNVEVADWQNAYEHDAGTLAKEHSISDPNGHEVEQLMKEIEAELYKNINKLLGTATTPSIP